MINRITLLLFLLFIVGCSPVTTTNQTQQNKKTIHKSSTVQPEKQQKPQYENIYQAIGSMTPMEMLELKSNVQKRAGRRELHKNVGSIRGEELYSLVENGEMTISQAIERSKTELTPVMKLIDDAYFKTGATTKDLLILKERLKNSWTQAESNRWQSLYTTLDNKEIAEKHTSTKIYDADKIALELKKYKKMLDDGLISQEDYDAKKNKLLGL